MKVALYHPWIHLKGGGERVILEILKRGRFKYTLYTNFYISDKTFSEFKKFKIINLTPKAKMSGVLKRGLFFGIKYILPSKIDLEKYDVFLVSTGGIAELITIRNHSIPTFCYCHTPLRAAHDWQYIRNYIISERDLIYKILFKTSKEAYKIIERPAWKYFRLVFANSNNTKNRLIQGKLVKENKIKVLYPGVDTRKFKVGGIFENFFFVPGRINKYKRQELAIKAFKKLNKKYKKHFRLIIAGFVADKDMWYYKYLLKLAKNERNILIIKNPSDREYIKLFQKCYAVLFTAINEDWGLVPLEANACGKLVISVNEGGPRESIKNGVNGFLVDADPHKFAKKMEFLIKNKRFVEERELICRKEALKYSWDNFIKKLENEIKSNL